MSPIAEVRVSLRVTQQRLAQNIVGLDGEVLSFTFTPEEQAELDEERQYTSGFMADFLHREEPNLDINSRFLSYDRPVNVGLWDIFEALRTLPRDRKESLLVKFLTEGLKDFPNGESFAKRLVWYSDISVLKPKKQPGFSRLSSLTSEELSRLSLPQVPVRIEDDAQTALQALDDINHFDKNNTDRSYFRWERENTIEKTMETIRSASDRNKAYAIAGDYSQAAVISANLDIVSNYEGDRKFEKLARDWNVGLETARSLSFAARNDLIHSTYYDSLWVLSTDSTKPSKEKESRPTEPRIKMYELGAMPLGVLKNEYLIFVPPNQKAA